VADPIFAGFYKVELTLLTDPNVGGAENSQWATHTLTPTRRFSMGHPAGAITILGVLLRVTTVIVLVNDQSLMKRPFISDMGLITTTVPREIKNLSHVHESLSGTLYLVGVLVHNNITL
jgi:hypothetical protein